MVTPTSHLSKHARALTEGRLLRDSRGRLVRNPVNDPGVILDPTAPIDLVITIPDLQPSER